MTPWDQYFQPRGKAGDQLQISSEVRVDIAVNFLSNGTNYRSRATVCFGSLRTITGNTNLLQLVVPAVMRNDILRQLHEGVMGGHRNKILQP